MEFTKYYHCILSSDLNIKRKFRSKIAYLKHKDRITNMCVLITCTT